jgi:hypothetical protein
MPYTLQLSDAKASPIRNVAGVSVDDQAFIDLINEAQRRLMRRGSFFELDQVMHFSLTGCDIVWPNFVGTVLGVKFCHGRPALLSNQNYSFVGPYHGHAPFASDVEIVDNGTACCSREVSGTLGKIISYHIVKPSDVGKTITLYGRQYGGQPLQELDTNGVLQMGLTLTAALADVKATALVTKIDSIVRQATDGMTYLYEADDAAGTHLRDISTYAPNETNPRYRRSCILGNPHHGWTDPVTGVKRHEIEALVKLAFIPVVNDRDFLMVDNLDALKFMVNAIRLEEANDEQGAEVKIACAIRELNMEMRDRQPQDQTPVRIQVLSGNTIRSP